MSHKAWIVVCGLVFLAMLGAALLISSHPVIPEAAYPDPVVQVDLSGTSLYANGEYGFTLLFKEGAAIREEFSPWRADAKEIPGTGVLEIRVGDSILRIGVSDIGVSTTDCQSASTDEQIVREETRGAASWTVFLYEGQERYRTYYGERCFAVEVSGPDAPWFTETIRSFEFVRGE